MPKPADIATRAPRALRPSSAAASKTPTSAERSAAIGKVGLALKRLQWRHNRDANRRLADLGLSYAQWDVLRHLAKRPDASLHALAELTFQTDQSMGALAKRMVERGLIERVDGPGRAVRHRLTPAGNQARETGGEVMASVLADSLGQLTEGELATLLALTLKAVG